WSASTAPGAGATMLVEARITDYLGYSAIIAQTFVLDSTPPTTTLTIPAYISSTNGISGIATDPAPVDAQVETVDVQLDDENEDWQSATIDPANLDDSRDWMFNIFGGGDGITRTFRVRVTDYADNVTIGGWETAVIDTIAPDLIVTNHASEISNTGADLALQGTVTDGSGVNHVTVIVYPDVGTPTYIDITPAGADWVYQPNLAIGTYNLYVQAEDIVGNQILQGPFDLTVLDKRLLTVTPAGNGIGTVTSNPVGINCGADCTELVDPGTVVTLTAVVDTGSTFTGWSGDCTGTSDCVLSMTVSKNITAT
ncbi:MAG: hypothetical protein GY942_03380, partial [Aestuariibacter sp.]|nr:hypothetical protein [Aestuariibacter sp.]